MGKKYRPIYECDRCHNEFDDPTQVRSFEGRVSDGEGDIIFIESDDDEKELELTGVMYCVDCIPIVLRLGDKLYIKNEIIKETHDHIEEDTESTEQVTTEPEQPQEPTSVDNETEKESENISESMTEQFEALELFDDGQYLVLYKITNDEQEEYVAKLYGHKDINSLRETYGGPLRDLYISSNGYVNDLPKNVDVDRIKVINKMIFGIPNIVEKEAYVQNDIAYIMKQDFDLSIEPVLFETAKKSETNVEEEIIDKEEIIDNEEEIIDNDNDYL